MPTAARLAAAICLGFLGYILSEQVRRLMPDGTDFGYFNVVNVVLGILAGWFVMGRRVGRGVVHGINNGVAGVFVLLLWGIAVQACYEMFRLAMRNRYDGAIEALLAIIEIGAEYAVLLATVPIALICVAGALIAGLGAEYAAKTWR